MTSKRAGVAAWAAIAAVCLLYGPMAVEYMWRFFTPAAPGLWDTAFASVVGHEMAEGEGSVFLEQEQVYNDSRGWLLLHTTLGGLAIMIAAAQFSQRLRARHLGAHRFMGRVQVVLVVASMVGAMAYLVRTGAERTFDGPAFHAQLWGLALGTLATSLLAVAAVVRGQIRMHQMLMALNFALLLTAPLLRVEYLVLGLAWPDQTQEVTNLAGAATLQALAIGGAIVASRRLDTRRTGPAHTPITVRPGVNRAVWAGSGVALLGVIFAFDRTGGVFDRVIASYLLATVGALVLFTVMAARAQRAGNLLAAGEWRVHQVAIAASPLAFAVLWPLYAAVWSTGQGFYAALLTATAVPLFAGFLAVAWSRRTPARAAPKTVALVAA